MIAPELEKATSDQVLDSIRNVPERQTLDYSELLPSDEKSKFGFLKAITSLANTAGGEIVVGVKEDDSLPVSVPGIQVDSREEVQLRLEHYLRDNVRPRLLVDFQWIELSDCASRFVLVCRVPKSWLSPHAILQNERFAFYARNSIGSYPMDLDQVRMAFTLKETVLERALKHRGQRVMHISKRDMEWMPVSLIAGPVVIVHVVPFGAFSNQFAIDLRRVYEDSGQLQPPRGKGWTNRQFSVFGLEKMDGASNGKVWTYASITRTGIIESVWGAWAPMDDNKYLPGQLEYVVVNAVKGYVADLKAYSLALPYLVCIALTGVKGFTFRNPSPVFREEKLTPLPHDPVLLPEVLVENFEQPIDQLMKPVMDYLWNAGGVATSHHYDQTTGRLKPQQP